MLSFLQWIFPSKCLSCGCQVVEYSTLCPKCFSKITFVDYPFCQTCGKALSSSYMEDCLCSTCQEFPREFKIARALLRYDEAAKSIIISVKKNGDNNTARICCKMIFTRYPEIFEGIDCIVAVPSHWTRLLKRGYNPASIIASELSRISGLSFRDVLQRCKKTQYQKEKSLHERLENVRDAFICKANLSGKGVLLVDDVFTTGATLNECAKTLKQADCREVRCITIATTDAI